MPRPSVLKSFTTALSPCGVRSSSTSTPASTRAAGRREHSVEMVDLVREGAREQPRAFELADRSRPSPARIRRRAGLTTFSATSGIERQPSSSFCSPAASRTTGLTRTIRSSGRAPTERSTIATRRFTPICGAARPIPGAAWQVSIMSAINAGSAGRSRVRLRVGRQEARIAAPATRSADHLLAPGSRGSGMGAPGLTRPRPGQPGKDALSPAVPVSSDFPRLYPGWDRSTGWRRAYGSISR